MKNVKVIKDRKDGGTVWGGGYASSTINIWHQSSIFVKINEPTLTHHYPKFKWKISACVAHSIVLDKCVMKCIYHFSIIQNSFTALKFCMIHLFIPSAPSPWQPLIFLLSLSFCFSTMSDSWNYTVHSLFRLASFT